MRFYHHGNVQQQRHKYDTDNSVFPNKDPGNWPKDSPNRSPSQGNWDLSKSEGDWWLRCRSNHIYPWLAPWEGICPTIVSGMLAHPPSILHQLSFIHQLCFIHHPPSSSYLFNQVGSIVLLEPVKVRAMGGRRLGGASWAISMPRRTTSRRRKWPADGGISRWDARGRPAGFSESEILQVE